MAEQEHKQEHEHYQDPLHWWYNHKTGDVEHGPQSLGSERDGPYATEADARRAPEIARERARAWAAEEEE